MNPFPLAVFLGLMGLAFPTGTPAETPQANPKALEAITETIKFLAKDPTVLTGTVGFYLAPLELAHEPLLKHQTRQSFSPASIMGPGRPYYGSRGNRGLLIAEESTWEDQQLPAP